VRHDTAFDLAGANPEGGPFDLTVDTVQVGGRYTPRRSGTTRPFVAATVGAIDL